MEDDIYSEAINSNKHQLTDLRSDAVTQPTLAMWEAMREARLGWAVMEEDPSVNELERHAADLTGKEAALFVPTGTMANLLALMTHTQRGDQIILEAYSHILWSEEWSFAHICGLVPRVIQGNSGHMAPESIREAISEQRFRHRPHTSLICLENTHTMAGGTIISRLEVAAISGIAGEHNIRIHLDGARIFNACIASGEDVKAFATNVDTLMFCLNKGLSAPAGAMLCGSRGFIEQSKINLRRLGGFSIHQAGILAAPALIALRFMIPQLAEDNRRARLLGEGLSSLNAKLIKPMPVETNIVMAKLDRSWISVRAFLDRLGQQRILAYMASEDLIRFVTHRHITEEDVQKVVNVVRDIGRA